MKIKFLKSGLAGFLVATMFFGGVLSASAQTSTTTLVAQIQSLLVQIQALQQQIALQRGGVGPNMSQMRQSINLTRQLARGMTGEEVTTLQEILAADPDVYPEGLVTGYFGPATERAVFKFQLKHRLEQVGFVGPKTRMALMTFVNNVATSSVASLPPGLAKKLNIQVYASTTVSSTTPAGLGLTVTICHVPPGNPNNKQTITVGAPALTAHLAHGDKLGACSGSSATTTPPATTTPDTVAPVLSNILASTTSSTTVVVSWDTNENANSIVWYGTSTPLTDGNAMKVESETLKLSHALNLSGLSASTTYYFKVVSKDAALNTATSSESFFVTP